MFKAESVGVGFGVVVSVIFQVVSPIAVDPAASAYHDMHCFLSYDIAIGYIWAVVIITR